jgi:hypothetical protein
LWEKNSPSVLSLYKRHYFLGKKNMETQKNPTIFHIKHSFTSQKVVTSGGLQKKTWFHGHLQMGDAIFSPAFPGYAPS